MSYPRRKSRATLRSAFRAPFAAGIHLAENPNTGTRKLSYQARYRLSESGPPVVLRTIPRGQS